MKYILILLFTIMTVGLSAQETIHFTKEELKEIGDANKDFKKYLLKTYPDVIYSKDKNKLFKFKNNGIFYDTTWLIRVSLNDPNYLEFNFSQFLFDYEYLQRDSITEMLFMIEPKVVVEPE